MSTIDSPRDARLLDFDELLSETEYDPDNRELVGALLIRSAQIDPTTLTEAQQERLYTVLAYVFVNVAGGSHNALQAALQRALTQPAVLEYFERRVEASTDFMDMLENNPAAPVILALLCGHEDDEIAEKAALALGYTGNRNVYRMLKRWLSEGTNKRLVRAAEIALPYFDV
ncbi:MAG TPA: hypothetical protein VKQ72_14930 [Aggregatilineales bacterium]|nr:hypothetical protein [Aggregatilineales bacterium]